MLPVHLTDFLVEFRLCSGIELQIFLLLRQPQGLLPRSTGSSFLRQLELPLSECFQIGMRLFAVFLEFQHHRGVPESKLSLTTIVHRCDQSAEDGFWMTPLGQCEQSETRRILAGKALVLIVLIVLSTFSLMLFQGLLARAYCVAVSALPSASLHVGVEDLDLRVLSIFVLSQPIFGPESLITDLALVRKRRLLFLLLLLFLSMLFLVYISNVSTSIS